MYGSQKKSFSSTTVPLKLISGKESDYVKLNHKRIFWSRIKKINVRLTVYD